jgi:hypothetical protein
MTKPHAPANWRAANLTDETGLRRAHHPSDCDPLIEEGLIDTVVRRP